MQKQANNTQRTNFKKNLQTTFKAMFQTKYYNKNENHTFDNLASMSIRKKSQTFDFVSCLNNTEFEQDQVDTPMNFQDLYELGEKVGQGSQSVIYKCFQKGDKTEKIYAAKMTRLSCDEKLENLKKTSMILKKLNHPNIPKVKYFGLDEFQTRFYVVTQFIDFPNLRDYMNETIQANNKISLYETISIIRSLLEIIQYLHSQGITHRDIKPENIMYSRKTGQLKLIDFDIAKKKNLDSIDSFMWTNTGTLHYKAPQMFLGEYNELIDIWAVGVILYEIIAQKFPFNSVYSDDVKKKIINEQVQFSQNIFIPILIQTLQKFLQKNPQKRFTARQALNLDIFDQNESPSKISCISTQINSCENQGQIELRQRKNSEFERWSNFSNTTEQNFIFSSENDV